MKKVKKWFLIVGLAGPTVANVSCSSAFLRDIRTAAISAVSNFVGEATTNILDQTINPEGT